MTHAAPDNARDADLDGGSVSDHLAIQQLVYRYAIALDNLDPVTLGECFAEDALLHGGGVELRGDIGEQLVGLHRRRRASRGIDHSMHHVSNNLFKVEGEVANGTTYCIATQFWTSGDEPTKVDLYIKYKDQLVKRGGRWVFLDRELEALFFTEVPALDWTLLPSRGTEQ